MRRILLISLLVLLPFGADAASFTLPIRALTPGAIDPVVTQKNIGSTICVVGYTKTVRPPVSYTNALKFKQL